MFHNILVDTRSIFNNLTGVPRPFLFEHAPAFILSSSINLILPMLRYILKDGYQLIFNEQSVFYVCQYDYSFFLSDLLE